MKFYDEKVNAYVKEVKEQEREQKQDEQVSVERMTGERTEK